MPTVNAPAPETATLNLALVQTQLVWEDAAQNHLHLSQIIATAPASTQLLVLPEMFATGFSMQSGAIAEPMHGASVQWLRQLAAERGIAACGSLAIKVDEQVYNRFVLAHADQMDWYDKRHLFRMGGEHKRYHSGQQRKVFHCGEWRVLPQVCYDLRFPVWSRNRNDYDLAIYVANWPAPRAAHWRALLVARAIENQCYVIGVNRVGVDGNQISYAGDSLVIDPKGKIVLDMGQRNGLGSCTIDLSALRQYREEFPAYLDADGFSLSS